LAPSYVAECTETAHGPVLVDALEAAWNVARDEAQGGAGALLESAKLWSAAQVPRSGPAHFAAVAILNLVDSFGSVAPDDRSAVHAADCVTDALIDDARLRLQGGDNGDRDEGRAVTHPQVVEEGFRQDRDVLELSNVSAEAATRWADAIEAVRARAIDESLHFDARPIQEHRYFDPFTRKPMPRP
jgi:hypothetical protein